MWTVARLHVKSSARALCGQQCVTVGRFAHSRSVSSPASRLGARADPVASDDGDLLSYLDARKMLHACTSREVDKHLQRTSRVVYSGVDPSAPSLHVGNLIPLMTLIHFAKWGHTPIVLIGGATGSIGDPSGRSSERRPLDPETLQHNVSCISEQIHSFFKNVQGYYRSSPISEAQSARANTPTMLEDSEDVFDYASHTAAQGAVPLSMGAKLVNNYTWMSGVSLLDFLTQVGRYARITNMLNRESVASRLDRRVDREGQIGSPVGLSYTEFSYQLLQAYDWSYLYKNQKCTLQVGGSDQLGNMQAGIDLIRRTHDTFHNKPAYGVTTPLLTTASGEKFGKSAGNAIWLDPTLTSDVHFYQYFLRTADEDLERYLMALTLLPLQEVRQIVESGSFRSGSGRVGEGQRKLAYHVTALIRGVESAEKAQAISEALYRPYKAPERDPTGTDQPVSGTKVDTRNPHVAILDNLDLALLETEPGLVVPLSLEKDIKGQDITKILIKVGMSKSRSEAKTKVIGGGVYLNNVKVIETDPRSVAKLLVKERNFLTAAPTDANKDPDSKPYKYFVVKFGANGPRKVIKIMP